MIEWVDCIFAMDSIVSGISVVQAAYTPDVFTSKIWIIYAGSLVGLFSMRFGAKWFVKILHKFPKLEVGAYGIVGWIGFTLILQYFFKICCAWVDLILAIGILVLCLFCIIQKRDTS